MTNLANSPWNKETEGLLKDWWENEGLFASEISALMGSKGYRISRNAVIGKVNRLKLEHPKEKVKKRLHDKMSQQAKALNVAKAAKVLVVMRGGKKFNPNRPKEVRMSISKPEGSNAVLLKNSRDIGICKYIIGYVDGKMENAVFCGDPTTTATSSLGITKTASFCEKHKKICYTEARK